MCRVRGRVEGDAWNWRRRAVLRAAGRGAQRGWRSAWRCRCTWEQQPWEAGRGDDARVAQRWTHCERRRSRQVVLRAYPTSDAGLLSCANHRARSRPCNRCKCRVCPARNDERARARHAGGSVMRQHLLRPPASSLRPVCRWTLPAGVQSVPDNPGVACGCWRAHQSNHSPGAVVPTSVSRRGLCSLPTLLF